MLKLARRSTPGVLKAPPGLIAYYRVSTVQQGRSGLGLEAQQTAVAAYAASVGMPVIAAFEEVESGKHRERPQLAAALAACRVRRATLVIAKLDRLARDAAFLLSVVEGTGEGGIAFCDLPQIPAGPTGKFLVTLLAAVAELEAGMISQRTKGALAAAKARGVKLGNPRLRAADPEMMGQARNAWVGQARERAALVLPYIEAAQRAGCTTLAQVAEALMARGVKTPSGGGVWHPTQVRRVLHAGRQVQG